MWDNTSQSKGTGAFAPNSSWSDRDFKDGTSVTIAFAEVKAFTPYIRDGDDFASGTAVPTNVSVITGANAGSLKGTQFGENTSTNTASGHTEWVDGRVHQTGFTTTFPPNTTVPIYGRERWRFYELPGSKIML